MKLRHPALIRCAALLLATVIRVWMGCVRKHIAQFNAEPHPSHPRRGRVIYAFWHEDVLFGVVQKAKIRVLVSQHSDGDLIARAANHLGRGAVRGSSTRGGSAAILEMVKRSDEYQLGVTPDGPRGPRRRVQLGVVFLASQTGRPVVPFGVGYTRAVRAKSWDRFAVPLPGSLAVAVIAPAVHVPPKLNRAQLEEYRRRIEEQLSWASDAAERWAATGVKPRAFLPSPAKPAEGARKRAG